MFNGIRNSDEFDSVLKLFGDQINNSYSKMIKKLIIFIFDIFFICHKVSKYLTNNIVCIIEK